MHKTNTPLKKVSSAFRLTLPSQHLQSVKLPLLPPQPPSNQRPLFREASLSSFRSSIMRKTLSKQNFFEEKSEDQSMKQTSYLKPKIMLRKNSEKTFMRTTFRRKNSGSPQKSNKLFVRMPRNCRIYKQKRVFTDCSSETIQKITGIREQLFDTLTSLQILFDYSLGDMLDLGFLLPQLRELNISGSNLESLRFLGTSFQKLQVLWVSRNFLNNLDGVNCYLQLRQLYSSFNQIKDLESVSYHPNIRVLDLEGNQLSSEEQLLPLATLSLQFLCLDCNPVLLIESTLLQRISERLGVPLPIPPKDEMDPIVNNQSLVSLILRTQILSRQEILQGVDPEIQEPFEWMVNEQITRKFELRRQANQQSQQKSDSECSELDELIRQWWLQEVY